MIFADPYAPAGELGDAVVAQLQAIVGLARGVPGYAGAVPPEYLTDTLRYHVIAEGEHRYDAWIVHGWLPLVVFAPGGREVVAWWSDQDDGTEGFADADAIHAAYEAITRSRA